MGETAQEVSHGSIFTADERRRVVRSFVDAYVRGTVQVTIWKGSAIMLSTQKQMTPEQRSQAKVWFIDLVSVVSGATQSSVEQVNRAIDDLFSVIVTYRSGGFITGEFVQSPDLETKLSAIQGRVDSLEKLIEELQHIWKVRGPPP